MALVKAARSESLEGLDIVKFLRDIGVDPKFQNSGGQNAWMWAV